MSYSQLSEDLYANYWDLYGHDTQARQRMIRKSVLAAAISALLVAGVVTGAVLISNTWRYTGYTEVKELILTPFDQGQTFVSGSPSTFHFSIVNRAHGSIDYKMQFAITATNTVIASVSGTLTQTGSGANCDAFNGTPQAITWTVPAGGSVTGLSPTNTAVMSPGDAGRQCFEASITMTFTLADPQVQDGTYTMDVTAVEP